MKKKEKIWIGAIVAITIILIVVVSFIVMNNSKKEDEENEEENNMSYKLEDGTRLNVSDKLSEAKKFEGMEISDIQITEKDNLTVLLAKITNISNEKQGGYVINIKIIDEQGEEIKTVPFLVKELKPGETTQLNASATFNFVNAYDFVVSKKEW